MSLIQLMQSIRRSSRCFSGCHHEILGPRRPLNCSTGPRHRILTQHSLTPRSHFRQSQFLFLPTTNITGSRLNHQSSLNHNEKIPLLINKDESPKELDEIYASPLRLLERVRIDTNKPAEGTFETSSTIINDNGQDQQWFTSTLTFDTRQFHSGKFNDFIQSLGRTDELFYKTLVLDGKVYYATESLAKEAAAARVLDCLAFARKHRGKIGRRNVDDAFQPLRYCVETPLYRRWTRGLFSCAPEYDWLCTLQQRYGPVGVRYDIQAEEFESSDDEGKVQTWYSATCIEPVTGEGFDSGVFGKSGYGISLPGAPESLPDASSSLLTLQEIKIRNGRVYYRDEQTARHAAAGRAADCYHLRNKVTQCIVDMSDVPMQYRYCWEEPYMDHEDKLKQSVDYEKLEEIVKYRRANPHIELMSEDLFRMIYLSSSMLHAPTSFCQALLNRLNMGYASISVYEKCFGGRNDIWYTSTVTDPVTGEKFHSGLVGKEVDAEKSKFHSIDPLHLAEVKVSDGKVYYKEAKLANHAAAARLLDCYIFRDADRPRPNHVQIAPRVQLCLEEPYKLPGDRDMQQTDYKDLIKMRDAPGEYNPEPKTNFVDPATFDESLLEMLQTNQYLLHVPSRFLHSLCNKLELVAVHSIHDKVFGDSTHKWFTASVTHPLTGEEFYSGLVGREVPVETVPGNELSTPLHLAEVKVFYGKVYYQDKNIASHAAAARCLDSLILRAKSRSHAARSKSAARVQLCLEDSYMSASERDMQKIDYEDLILRRNSSVTDYQLPKDYHSIEDAIDNTDDSVQFLDVFCKQTVGSSRLSTIGRIAEIWTSGQNQESTDASISDESIPTKLNNALAWYKHAYKSQQTPEALAHLCKSTLKILCDCNRDEYASSFPNLGNIDIKKEANTIWEKLYLLQSHDLSFIDTNACNSYLGCMDFSDSASAAAAEALLVSMANGEKYGILNVTLPPPDVDTYNIVMNFWSRAPSISRKSGVNRIYSLMEDFSRAGSTVKPNIDTFKILFAINSKHDDGRFSFDNANTCLGQMQEASRRFNDPTLRPNLDIYTAALKKTTSDVNHYDYKPAWLCSGKAFDGGFRDATIASTDEGLEAEEWCVLMEKNGIAANNELLEEIIQIWINNGTLDGLLRAENWAKRIIMLAANESNDRLTPRHQTFKPIIAAWTLCGNQSSPTRVSEWVNQLTQLSFVMPNLSPDLETLAAKVLVWRRFQVSLLEQSSQKALTSTTEKDIFATSDQDIELAFQLARSCCKALEEVLANTNLAGSLDAEATAPMFTSCIAAWGDASRLAQQAGVKDGPFCPMVGVQEMIKVVRLFDSKLEKAIAVKRAEKSCGEHTIQCIGEIYSEVIAQLHQLDCTSCLAHDEDSVNSDASVFGERIADVERLLRLYEYYSRSELANGSSDTENKATRLLFYRDVLLGCQCVSASSDYGHVLRICNLIIDSLSWSKDHCTCEFANSGDDISSIYVDIALISGKCVKHPKERKQVLSKIFDSASQYFDHKEKTNQFWRVDRSSIIGAMRLALVGIDDAESFLRSFEERPLIQRRVISRRHNSRS